MQPSPTMPASTAALFAAVLLAGCSGPVERRVHLQYQGVFPHGRTQLVGDRLDVEIEHIEGPGPGRLYTAWGRGEPGWIRLGAVTTSAATSFVGADLGVDWTQLDEIAIGLDEIAVGASAPALGVVFRGPPGAVLSFGGLAEPGDEALDGLEIEATVEDESVVFDAEPLPALTSGAAWVAWLMLTDGDFDDAIRIGTVAGGEDSEFVLDGIVANGVAIDITVEIEGADPGPATETISFSGPMLSSMDEAPAAEPTPDGHGDHVH